MTASSTFRRAIILMLIAGLAVAAALLLCLWFWPLGLDGTAPANPITGYAQAIAAVDRIVEAEGDAVNPVCNTRLLSHGDQTEHVAVIFHGVSNCPQQFAALAEALYAHGYNVLLARLPRQGLADRLSEEPAQASAEEALAMANAAVDIAHGLGNRVIAVGMSGGGTLAAWIAQNRSDVERVVLVSPLFGVQNFPAALTRPIATLVRRLPNWWGWFDPERKEQIEGPAHAYPRYSSRTVAEYLRLASKVTGQAQAAPPAVQDIRLVGNLGDESIRTEMYRAVVDAWEAHGADALLYEFPISAGLKHDMIDPSQPDQKVEIVYPVLLDAITADEPAGPQ